MVKTILLEGTLYSKNYNRREKVIKILKETGIPELGFSIIFKTGLNIGAEITVDEKFNSDVYLKNLKDKLTPYVNRGNNLKLYSFEKEIEF